VRENIVEGSTISGRSTEEIVAEIQRAFGELRKSGYKARFEELNGELILTFALGESQQTIKLPRAKWSVPQGVYQAVIDRLDI
jgi:hypothetical protein